MFGGSGVRIYAQWSGVYCVDNYAVLHTQKPINQCGQDII